MSRETKRWMELRRRRLRKKRIGLHPSVRRRVFPRQRQRFRSRRLLRRSKLRLVPEVARSLPRGRVHLRKVDRRSPVI